MLTRRILTQFRCRLIVRTTQPPRFSFSTDGEPPNLLNEPIRGFTFNPFLPFVNFLKFVWFKYKYDNDFSIKDLEDGGRKALTVVAQKLYSRDLDSLEALVLPGFRKQLQTAAEKLNDEDRKRLLDFKESDIFLSFILRCQYRNDLSNSSKQYFDVLIVYHGLKDFESKFVAAQKDAEGKPIMANITNSNLFKQMQSRFAGSEMLFANLMLSKKVLPTVDDDWSVSYFNVVGVPTKS